MGQPGDNGQPSALENLLSQVGQGVGKVPVLGDAARFAQGVLVGPGADQLRPLDQAVRAFTTAVVAGNNPGAYPALMSAYQTNDEKTAIARRTALQSDDFQDEYQRRLHEQGGKKSAMQIFSGMSDLYPELRGYVPPLRDGAPYLPPSQSAQAASEMERGKQMNAAAPIGTRVETTVDSTGKVTHKLTDATLPPNVFPESVIKTSPILLDQLNHGYVTQTPIGVHEGQVLYRIDKTPAGEASEASQKTFATKQAGALAEQTPLPGMAGSPDETPLPGSPAAIKEAGDVRKTARQTAAAEERQRNALDVKNQDIVKTIDASDSVLQKYITPDAFPIGQTAKSAGEAFEYSFSQRARGLGARTDTTKARQDFLAALDSQMPNIAQAGKVNRFNQTEIATLRSTLADPSLSLPEVQERWSNFVDEAKSRVAGNTPKPLEGQESHAPKEPPKGASLTPEQRANMLKAMQ